MKKSSPVLTFFLALLLGWLSPAHAADNTVQVKGVVQGIETVDDDGFIDGALVIPSLKAEAILRFDLSGLMAPDEVLEAGPEKANVPGNLYFPKQTETYIVFPVTLRKESFSVYPTRGEQSELVALSFRASFSDLISMAKNKAPFTEMIPLVQLQKYGFSGARDWSAEKSITMTVNQDFDHQLTYTWDRSPAPDGNTDLIVAFQRTPMNRWMLTNITGKPDSQGAISSGASFRGNDLKVVFARLNNGSGREPVSATALIRKSDGTAPVQAGELPNGIANAAVQSSSGSTIVTWQPIAGPGWMAILRSMPGPKDDSSETQTNLALRSTQAGPGCLLSQAFRGIFRMEERSCRKSSSPFDALIRDEQPDSTALEAWTSGSSGTYTLRTPLRDQEKVTLLYVGTEKPTAAPDSPVPSTGEPEVFTYAQEIRMLRL